MFQLWDQVKPELMPDAPAGNKPMKSGSACLVRGRQIFKPFLSGSPFVGRQLCPRLVWKLGRLWLRRLVRGGEKGTCQTERAEEQDDKCRIRAGGIYFTSPDTPGSSLRKAQSKQGAHFPQLPRW